MKGLPDWAWRGRGGWQYTGERRPDFAPAAKPGQESAWDYPRPPRLVDDARTVCVAVGDITIARSTRCLKVQETASPPTFYLPPDDIDHTFLKQAEGTSLCEWKGAARYWHVVTPSDRLDRVAWSYPEPFPEFDALRDYVSFYPARIHCTVNDERVVPQPGQFYGGWITRELVGPFKGEPGSGGW